MNSSQTLESNLLYILVQNPHLVDIVEVEENDFHYSDSKEIFNSLKEMRRDGKEINLAMLDAEMSKKGVRTSFFIEELRSDCIGIAAFDDYCAELKEMAVSRALTTLMESDEAPATIIEKARKLGEKLQTKKPKTLSEAYKEYLVEYEERKAKKGATGITTGFNIIDTEAPLEPSTLTILAARSSIGKSAFALTLARNAAEYGHNVLFISAEMSIPRLLDRLFAIMSNVPAKRFRMGDADGSIMAIKPNVEKLSHNLRFIYLPYCSSQDVYRLAAKENAKRKVDLVIVDYLQYLRDPKGKNDGEAVRIGNMTRNLKGLAGSCNCAVLALSQVNRMAAMNEGGMPELHQLRDSGAIEQDADIVLILNREERTDTFGQLIIAKNRNGEPDIKIPVTYNMGTTEFTMHSTPKPVEVIDLPYKDM